MPFLGLHWSRSPKEVRLEKVTRIVMLVASGPGIAAPVFERRVIERYALDENDAAEMDSLAAAADILHVSGQVPLGPLFDGPHKSHITVTIADGSNHSVSFVGTPTTQDLKKLVDFVLSKAGAGPV